MSLWDKITDWINQHHKIQMGIQWLKTTSLPGFQKIPIWNVLRLLHHEWMEGNIGIRANSMAFSFFISLFPTLILLISIIPYIPIENFDEIFYNYIFELLPTNTENWLGTTIKNLSEIPRGGIVSISILMTLYFSSNGVLNMMAGFEKSFDTTFKSRNFFQKRFIAFWLTGILFLFIIIAVIFVIASDSILNLIFRNFIPEGYLQFLFTILHLVLVFVIFYVLIAIVYRYAPAFRNKTPFFSPGTFFASLGIIIISFGFAYFVNNFGTYNRVYGSLGAMIVLMLWIELICFILLIGFEINASIALNRDIGTFEEYKELNSKTTTHLKQKITKNE